MLSVMELQAVADGLLDPAEAMKLDRHPGGRPKGAKNNGPDALDKAILALAKQRSKMSDAERELSERRIAALLKGRGKRGPYEHDLAARATEAEKRVAKAYRQSEDRIGMSRKRRVVDPDGKLIPGKAGYVAEPYPECVPFVDVGLRMERHPNGWLAPVHLTQSFTLHKLDLDHLIETGEVRHMAVKTVTGAGTGSNGHAYAVPAPTAAEGYAAYLEDPGRESDWSGCPLDKAGEFIPAWYEHKTSRRKRLQRVGFRLLSEKAGCYNEMVPLDYACCKATLLVPKSNGPAVVHKKPLDTAATCHRAVKVKNRRGKAGEPMYVAQGAYRPLQRFVEARRRDAGVKTPTGSVAAEFCNGVHLDDLLKLAGRDPSEIKLPVIQPVVQGFLPKRLDIVFSMADAKPTSVVWFRDYVGPGPLHAHECEQCGAAFESDDGLHAGLCEECFLADCRRAEGLDD
jgi:hypothetical protein